MVDPTPLLPVNLAVEQVDSLSPRDMDDLCDAADAAIRDGGGFGWLSPPRRETMERYWRGVLVVPLRSLFIGRIDGEVVGSAQLYRPPPNNEAQQLSAQASSVFVHPRARGLGLAHRIIGAVEDQARRDGFEYLQVDIRETQHHAIRLYESMGFSRWGTNPAYAKVDGKVIAGHYYLKRLA